MTWGDAIMVVDGGTNTAALKGLTINTAAHTEFTLTKSGIIYRSLK